jgi:hypothetical protein
VVATLGGIPGTVLVFFALCFAWLGCARSIEPSLLTPNALEGEKERILAMRAPRYSASGDAQDRRRFVEVDVQRWAGERARRTNRLIARYEVAISEADDQRKEAELFSNIARLEWTLCREFFEVVESVMGVAPEDARPFRSKLVADVPGLKERLDTGTNAAVACMERSPPSPSVTRARCESTRRMISVLGLAEQASP